LSSLVARHDATLGARIAESFELRHRSGWYVRAGSALVQVGDRLLAVQDDSLAVVWIDPATRALDTLVLGGTGGALSKTGKPDFEAAFVHAGSVWILGSGTTPNRRRFARIDPGQAPTLLDRGPLYDAVAEAIAMPPNIEGAVPLPGCLRLFHRGPGRKRGANFAIDVPLAVLTGGAPRILSLTALDLGTLGGLSLGVTDAVVLADGRIVYLAVAEDTPDGIADGPVAGAAVGILAEDGGRWAQLVERDGKPSMRKVEGIVLNPDGTDGWLLTDPDDASLPAELCRVELDF